MFLGGFNANVSSVTPTFYGSVVIGNELFARVYGGSATTSIYVYTLPTGTLARTLTVDSYQSGIGTDGTNLYIRAVTTGYILTIDKTTGATTSTKSIDMFTGFGGDYIGSFWVDTVADRLYFSDPIAVNVREKKWSDGANVTTYTITGASGQISALTKTSYGWVISSSTILYTTTGSTLGTFTPKFTAPSFVVIAGEYNGVLYTVSYSDLKIKSVNIIPLTERTTLNTLTVGDYIECEYTATSGAVGTFANLGNASKSGIPVAGSTTPNGKFNFICVDRTSGKGGLCIADRPVQHTISWDTLNAKNFIEGELLPLPLAGFTYGSTNSLGTATASSAMGGLPATNAFDGSAGSEFHSSGTEASPWIKMQFSTPTVYNSLYVMMNTTAHRPKNWKIQGSTDNSTWVDLYGKLSDTWTAPETRHIRFFNTVAYTYYRIICTQTSGTPTDGSNKYLAMYDLQYYYNPNTCLIRSLSGGNCYAEGLSLVPFMTSNTAPAGYIISASTEYNSTTYAAWNAFDNSTNAWSPTIGSGINQWVKVQLPVARTVRLYLIKGQTTTYAPTAWTFEGSNNGTTWTTLDTKSGVTSWVADEVKTFPISNTTAYLMYRWSFSGVNGGPGNYNINTLGLYDLASSTPSITDKKMGAYPTNNEWDTYIVRSSLGGKITVGDNTVWNWSGLYTWGRETQVAVLATNTARVVRGSILALTWDTQNTSATSSASICFRPVLEFAEDGTIFY